MWNDEKGRPKLKKEYSKTNMIKHEYKNRKFSPHHKNEVFLENLKSLVNCG